MHFLLTILIYFCDLLMQMMQGIRRSVFMFLLSFSGLYAKPLTLDLWHSLAGDLGAQLTQITEQFNHSQKNYSIKPIYKGEYTDALTSFAAAFRAQKPPAIIQVQEVGTAVLLHPSGIIKPLDSVMREQGMILEQEHFIPAIAHFYSEEGRLQAMPFNISIPVLYYNASVLARFGIDAQHFPQSWQALELLLAKLKKAGYSCGYTSAYPSWIHIESFLALHGLDVQDAQKKQYTHQALLTHLKRLEHWQALRYFEYGGRKDEATALFSSGRCILFSQSSGAYNSLAATVPFQLGVASLPIDYELSPKRYANVLGGAALWVVSGQTKEHYQGIAAFIAFLATPAIQAQWHKHTGYIPLGLTGTYAKIREESKHPTLALASSELSNQEGFYPSHYKGPQNQIRALYDEALEEIFSHIKTPEQALIQAESRAHYLLRRFLANAGEIKNKSKA